MLENILKIQGVSLLNKKQQSTVAAGNCSVFVRLDNGTSYWSSQTYSVAYAQEGFATGGDALHGGFSITGYCCASCSNYSTHPSYAPSGGGGISEGYA